MRSHTGCRGERNIPYKGVETSPYEMCLKTMRLTAIRKGSKQIISTSVGLELLQMVSEPDTKQCTSEDADPQKRWIVRSWAVTNSIRGRHRAMCQRGR